MSKKAKYPLVPHFSNIILIFKCFYRIFEILLNSYTKGILTLTQLIKTLTQSSYNGLKATYFPRKININILNMTKSLFNNNNL